MEPSPLTQQARPESFQPKIVHLYEAIFNEDEETEKSEGFWREFFLLRPDKPRLQQIVSNINADDFLNFQNQTRRLFFCAISHVKAGKEPSDENAFDVSAPSNIFKNSVHSQGKTLTAFLGGVLQKKYTNPSSDVINILAGLDQVDAIFTEFVGLLDITIRHVTLRRKAIEAALSMASGAYQTGLISYFTHRDLFPSLMKYVQDTDDASRAFEPFTLLGLLSNSNKFEFQNPYRLRLDDFVNETAIHKIIKSVGRTCAASRARYVAVQDDLPEGWNLNTTMTFLGLGALAPGAKTAAVPPTNEEAKILFAELPDPGAAILLATYDFANANKLFCFNLVTLPAEERRQDSPFGAFLSLTSYLFQHAYRSPRAASYVYLNLLVLRILIEDQVLCKRMCSDESRISIRLCRQRQPNLPLVSGDRILATAILDTMVDGINHNLRRKLDVDLYIICLRILLRMVSHLSRSRIRLVYHWSELWRCLLSLLRFLTTYSADLANTPNLPHLLDLVVNLIALSLSSGYSFLPGPAEYDDLFYKLVETGEVLTKFRDAYGLASRASNSIGTLILVSSHYYALLESSKTTTRSKHLSGEQVSEVIKQGYETLSITAKDGLDSWDKYREADEKTVLKKIAKIAVSDAQRWLMGS
ncbi:MAG: hypothetical protein M1829_006229 [Trizodia sp. TS-e1964]|nr:MAG: hypothetical protein M1829_006229 [Trizodia sp. TS-e1964]